MTGRARLRRVAFALWAVAVVGLLGALLTLNVLGWRIEVVATGSMAPTAPEGTAALVAPVDASSVARLEVGDVITYEAPGQRRRVLHRVVEVVGEGGTLAFRTQGDANESPDARLVPAASVRGRLRTSAPWIGTVLAALRPPLGLVWLVGVPLLVLSLGELARRRRPGAEPDRAEAAAPDADVATAGAGATSSRPGDEADDPVSPSAQNPAVFSGALSAGSAMAPERSSLTAASTRSP